MISLVLADVIPRELHSVFRMLNPPNVENQVSWAISAFLRRAKSTYASYITPSASSSTPSVPRLLDIFTLKPSSQSTEKFISETAALVQFIEEGVASKDRPWRGPASVVSA